MNPVEKVKTLLNGYTEPFCKDSPFGAGGRKIVFNSEDKETQNLSYQAFFNRISTFKPEFWGSDPNAAIYLAKYGFQSVSRCKVQCCSCHIEVDLEIFLRKPDVLQTLAVKSHKQSCRWLHVSTPKVYFEIPRNPHKVLRDVKITFSDLTTFESDLPLILKEKWLKMGISEDFMMSVLNFLKYPYSDTLASCIVLSLCGWVKSSDTTLQCNFCRRVVGIWNFFSDKNENPKPSTSKNTSVISLLYSKIRHGMMNCEESVREEESGVEAACVKESTDQAGEEATCQEVVSEKGICGEVADTEMNVVIDNKLSDADSSCTSSSYSEEQMSTSSSSYEERTRIAFLRLNNWRDPRLALRAKELKRKALKCLWTKSRRFRERYFYKVLRVKMEKEVTTSGQCEFLHAVSPKPVFSDMTEFIHAHKTDVSNSWVSDNNENDETKVDLECKNNIDSASRDENGYCSAEHCKSEESCSQCVKSSVPLVTHTLQNDKCNKIESNSAVEGSGNFGNSNDSVVHLKSTGVKDIKCSSCHREKSSSRIYNSNCDVEIHTEKSDLHGKHCNCSNKLDSSVVLLNQSEKSCDISEVGHDDSYGNSDGRRKRKRVPENEQNGAPYDEDEIPLNSAPLTRNKKKEFQSVHSVHLNPKSKSSDMEIVKAFTDGHTSGTDIAAVSATKTQETGITTSTEAVNDVRSTENNETMLENHEEETEFTPVISSVVGNFVRSPTLSEKEEMETEKVQNNDQEFSSGPIIVSSKSVCGEGMLQDYVEEGRNLENGFRANQRPDISESEQENSLSKGYNKENVSGNGSSNFGTAKSSAVNLQDNVQTPSCKRKRCDSDEDSNCVLKKSNVEEYKWDLCRSYFHPEFEHRYWCIWRVYVADYLKISCERKKGWEYYAEYIKKALELRNRDNLSMYQIENSALDCLADIVSIARQRK